MKRDFLSELCPQASDRVTIVAMNQDPIANQSSNPQANWQAVARWDDLPDQAAIEVVIGEAIIGIFREGDAIWAVDAICAHQGGPLVKGKLADGCITCPWHGWRYRLSDGFNTTTGRPMLSTYPVRQINGAIEVFA